MQLDFFPSRTLTLYLAKMFVVRILAVLVMLVLVLLALDLLGSTGRILEPEGNGQAEIWRYASLRIPQLISRFLPYSVLLATLITLVTLNQNSEVVAMKAAGLSAHQVLAPLLLTSAIVAVVSFAFNERVVTRANGALKAWEAVDYGPLPQETGVRANVYLTDGTNILTASSLVGRGNTIELDNVTWYERAPGGIISSQIRATEARYAAPGWRLENPVRFDVGSAETEELDALVVGTGLTPDQIDLQSVDPDAQSFWELSDTIDA
ncbi:MAG: LptF/LptG family permease, partial [Pseudomonadota bacterium]